MFHDRNRRFSATVENCRTLKAIAFVHYVKIRYLGCGAAQLGCGVAQLRCGVGHSEFGVDQIGCSVAHSGCGVAEKGAAWLTQQRVGLLQGSHEFESRLRTPEEALYQAEAMRRSRVGTRRVVYTKYCLYA